MISYHKLEYPSRRKSSTNDWSNSRITQCWTYTSFMHLSDCTTFAFSCHTSALLFSSVTELLCALDFSLDATALAHDTLKSARHVYKSAPNQGYVAQELQEIGGDQPLQSRIKGFDFCNGQQRNLPVLRVFFKKTMIRSRLIGKLISKIAHAENVCSLRRWIDKTTKTELIRCRILDTW